MFFPIVLMALLFYAVMKIALKFACLGLRLFGFVLHLLGVGLHLLGLTVIALLVAHCIWTVLGLWDVLFAYIVSILPPDLELRRLLALRLFWIMVIASFSACSFETFLWLVDAVFVHIGVSPIDKRLE